MKAKFYVVLCKVLSLIIYTGKNDTGHDWNTQNIIPCQTIHIFQPSANYRSRGKV